MGIKCKALIQMRFKQSPLYFTCLIVKKWERQIKPSQSNKEMTPDRAVKNRSTLKGNKLFYIVLPLGDSLLWAQLTF